MANYENAARILAQEIAGIAAHLGIIKPEPAALTGRQLSQIAVDIKAYVDQLHADLKALREERDRLKQRLLSAAGDDLCRLTQEEIRAYTSGKVQIPPEEEFIPSCRRFHAQVASDAGVLKDCLTMAQLIAENEKLSEKLNIISADVASSGPHDLGHLVATSALGTHTTLIGRARYEQLKKAEAERDQLAEDMQETRKGHATIARGVKAALGFKNWPNFEGDFQDAVGRFVAERIAKLQAEEHEIQQTLGKALGMPWYKDDPENFPTATEADGVCVGEHVAVTLATAAAKRIVELEAELRKAQGKC